MKKVTLIFAITSIAVGIQSCGKKLEIEPSLKKTTWISEDGTKTLEFTKKEILMNSESIYSGKGEIHVEEGQIWAEESDSKIYFFDYKISGQNLFVATETTSAWDDPSSPAVVSEKYKQN